MAIWKLIKRELSMIFIHDVRRGSFLFGAALAYLLIFGFLYYPGVVKDIPTILCDESQTALSRELVRHVYDSDSLSVVAEVSAEEDVRNAMRDGTACTAIVIPEDFSKDIRQGSSATVLVMMDGSNIITMGITTTAVQDILFHSFAPSVAARRSALETNGDEGVLKKVLFPVQTSFRVLNNPTQSYLYFFVLGLAVAAMQQGMLMSIIASVEEYYHNRHWIRDYSVATWAFVLLSLYLVLSVLAFCLILVSAVALFGFVLKGAIWQFILLGLSFSYAVLSLGMLAGTVFREELQAIRASIMFTVPSFVLGGFTWPIEMMGETSQWLASCIPMTWTAIPLRYLFLSGRYDLLYHSLIMLIVIGTACNVMTAFLIPRRLNGKGAYKPG